MTGWPATRAPMRTSPEAGRTGPLLDQRSAELETDNHRLRQQLTRAQAETRELTDTLEAARAMNRQLVNELNRSAPPHAAARSPRHKT